MAYRPAVRLAVLTGGGDCPGLNAAIRGIVRTAVPLGDEIIGFNDAWGGVLADDWRVLDVTATRGILPRGGTILGTARGSPFDTPDGTDRVLETLGRHRIDALIVIGGNGSLTVAELLHRELGIPILGVPKTIDNDVVGTDRTFGFATAVQIASDAIDRLHSTAESHHRVMVVELMGRHAGWIAAYAGVSGGATVVLVPELPYSPDRVVDVIRRRHQSGRYASIVVVAEGAVAEGGAASMPERPKDRFGHVILDGVGRQVGQMLADRTGFEARVVVLGHVQRGGTPVAEDRVLATRMGVAVVGLAHDGAFGQMVALRGTDIVGVPLAEAAGRTRTLGLTEFAEVRSVSFG